MEDAIFRNNDAFTPANLKEHLPFWEHEILKDHPHKQTILKWLKGVRIEEFLNSFTTGSFQGIELNSYYPAPQHFDNYVPAEFHDFMNDNVQEWVNLGVLEKWDEVRTPKDPKTPLVVCPLGVEPKKPRGLWDGRYVNEFCRDIPFTMDNAAKVAETSWVNAYLFKMDHKNGYFHVPLHKDSRKYFGVFWKGIYYVLTVLPFGWKSSPLIYHSITEAANMYIRSLGIPMLGWIDDMLGMTEQIYKESSDDMQFKSAMRAMVVVSIILFKAGYFMGISKCCLIPEQFVTYLGIDCDTKYGKFLVPKERADKYLTTLQHFLSKQWISFAELERMVGKLVSLECAVPAGMWYTREQYSAMRLSGVSSMDSKKTRELKYIKVSEQIRQEWSMWIFFLSSNTGTPWKTFANLFLQADIASDASGRAYAGVVDFPEGPTKITSGEFQTWLLKEDIQVKEAEALRATISMLVSDMPEQIKGKTLVCKVDNQVLKAVWERKGTSQNLMLNNIGKQIFWLQYLGQFYINLQYVRSEENVSDKFTRQSPGLEASLSQHIFNSLWKRWGPFQWDIMASAATVKRDPQGRKLSFFSRYFEETSSGVDLFAQNLSWVENAYCFPPTPLIGMVLKFLREQKKDCVMILPAINAPWVNMASAHIVDLIEVSKPFQKTQFTVLNQSGKRIPKQYPHTMIAAKLCFKNIPDTLAYLHL